MALSDNLRGSANDELRALREQVKQLMEERVAPAFADATKLADQAVHRARAYTGDQAEAVAGRVRDQPLMAIGAALALGFLFGRITK
jgi:ElaB/YqjD/DUF883 family membrane-anchored ribosome-binding protein